MGTTINTALDNYITKLLNKADQQQSTLRIQYDNDWPSICYQQNVEQGDWVDWKPELQNEKLSFSKLEQALEIKLDEQYCAYFTRYFSENLPATASRGDCELLQVLSATDFERLQENLIGHILMKRRLRQPETLFFAMTSDDDFILTVDNTSGAVLLERVGKKSDEVLAEDLASFINQLTPRLPA